MHLQDYTSSDLICPYFDTLPTMGGCRCTYRNCTVKSDGKTHMFHYPVFEKVRCHQWLINAHRLEFLNLKVSQLKNRVVCQHHFKDENFMNFKKDKLTFDAIPTEDGPYCDTSKYVDLNPDSSKLFSIIIEDIDNDYNDKKANYSLKYGDYLANLDLMDLEKIDEDNVSYKNTYNGHVDILSPHKSSTKDILFSEDCPFLYNVTLPDTNDKKSMAYPTLTLSPYTGGTEVIINDVKSYLNLNSNNNNISTDTIHNILFSNVDEIVKQAQPQSFKVEEEIEKKEPRVKIMSEKKITNPVPIIGKFEPVSPNFVLNVKRKPPVENTYKSISEPIEIKEIYNQNTNNTIEFEIKPLVTEDREQPKPYITSIDLLPKNCVLEKSPKMISSPPSIKPKVPPERLEAINKKREFNMKLRDMVESCLDKLPNEEKKVTKKNTRSNSKKTKAQQKSPPQKKPNLSTKENAIAYLEARMTIMENRLLEKIEQNSMKIIDLKNTFMKTESEKRLVVHRKHDEEIHKKELFKEIAKYLSPSSKSLIYEELFINKFSINEPFDINEPTTPNHKRRRHK